jgi:hypothetical protein
MVVQVAYRLANWQFDGQHVGYGVFGGGFARAAGDCYDAASPALARPGG